MNKLRLKILTFFTAVFLLGVVPGQSALALSQTLMNRYAQNSIMFYDPDCKKGTTEPGDGDGPEPDPDWEYWDGVSCTAMTQQRINWLQDQVSDIQAAATANGIPWELVPAQAILESGGGKAMPCPFNPLGLKAKGGQKSCDGTYAEFNSYAEAYDYYMNSIIPVKALKFKYPNNPYYAISYMQYGTGGPPYAVCDKESYPGCAGNLGKPTPGYPNNVGSIICGIQKWAKSQGIAISSVTWENYKKPTGAGGEGGGVADPSDGDARGAVYCGGKTINDPNPISELQKYVKQWAWPTYHKAPYTERMPAYATYMSQSGIYKGDCSGVDCGAFVANVIKASGWDPSYPQASTSTQGPWLESHWQEVSVNSLKAGDVGYRPGHVILYVGTISGFQTKTASASQCERAPTAGSPNEKLDQYTWYRKK